MAMSSEIVLASEARERSLQCLAFSVRGLWRKEDCCCISCTAWVRRMKVTGETIPVAACDACDGFADPVRHDPNLRSFERKSVGCLAGLILSALAGLPKGKRSDYTKGLTTLLLLLLLPILLLLLLLLLVLRLHKTPIKVT